jgi:hypothetical protein
MPQELRPCSVVLGRSRIFRGLLPTLLGVMSIATFVAVYETLKDVRTCPPAGPTCSACMRPVLPCLSPAGQTMAHALPADVLVASIGVSQGRTCLQMTRACADRPQCCAHASSMPRWCTTHLKS